MMDKTAAYAPKWGGCRDGSTVYGLSIVVHTPRNTDELEKRVAQAHVDAIMTKVKRLNCSDKQKKGADRFYLRMKNNGDRDFRLPLFFSGERDAV